MLTDFTKHVVNRFEEISPCKDPNGFNALVLGRGSGVLGSALAESCTKSHFDVVEVDKKMADAEMWYVMKGAKTAKLPDGGSTDFQTGKPEVILETYARGGKQFHNIIADCASVSEKHVQSHCGDVTFATILLKVLSPCGTVQLFVLPSQSESIKAIYKRSFPEANWDVQAFQGPAEPVGSIEIMGSAASCSRGGAATKSGVSTATVARAATATPATATTATETTTRVNMLRQLVSQISDLELAKTTNPNNQNNTA